MQTFRKVNEVQEELGGISQFLLALITKFIYPFIEKSCVDIEYKELQEHRHT